MTDILLNDGSLASGSYDGRISGGNRLTFADAIDHLDAFVNGHGFSASMAQLKRAVLRAYDEIIHTRQWRCLRAFDQVTLHAAQQAGTVSYDHATRTLTLTGATWPAWADKRYGGALWLDGILCVIERRISDSTALLDQTVNPDGDLTDAGYTLLQWWVPMPEDFLVANTPMAETFYRLGRLAGFEEIVEKHRWSQTTGEPSAWAIGPNPTGGSALYVWPAPTSDVRLGFPYWRRPRDLRFSGNEPACYVGTVAVAGTTVTGTTTAFTPAMAGAIWRIAPSTTTPTGLEGPTPYVEEHAIRSVTSATELTLETAASAASGKAYRISDPVDVPRILWDAVLTCAEKHLARATNRKEYHEIARNADEALTRAKTSDSPEQVSSVVWPGPAPRPRLADIARGLLG